MRYNGTIRRLFSWNSGSITFEENNEIKVINFYNQDNLLIIPINKNFDDYKQKIRWLKYDEVSFYIDSNPNAEGELMAAHISLVANEKLKFLHSMIEEDNIIAGFCQKLKKKHYIKEEETNIFFPLVLPHGVTYPEQNDYIFAKVDNTNLASLRHSDALLEDGKYKEDYEDFFEMKDIIMAANITSIKGSFVRIELQLFKSVNAYIKLKGKDRQKVKKLFVEQEVFVLFEEADNRMGLRFSLKGCKTERECKEELDDQMNS